MPPSTDDSFQDLFDRLSAINAETTRTFPGDDGRRQPVHTVYGGAQIFTRETAPRLGSLALRSLADYAPDPSTFAEAVGFDPAMAESIYERVEEKLGREPVEDFRIDFEDGYGHRPDEEEDRDASRTALEVAAARAGGTLPPFIGIRIKPLTEELKVRSLRTLEYFVTTLAEALEGSLPERFVVTLPKVTSPGQVEVFVEALEVLEARLGLAPMRFELMVETAQTIFDREGSIALPAMVAAGKGRCVGAHFGTYDYTAGADITAAYQSMVHPACDFARSVMQVALSGTGVHLSDGATNVLPVRQHRPTPDQPELTDEQVEANRQSVHGAWRLHYDHVRHSLERAFYQGWDLHPAQLPTRYAAVYSFFLEGFDAAADRLSHFVGVAAKATLVGDVFDDAATGQGLLNYFLRAVNCGAVSEADAVARTGLSVEEIRSRSFVAILEGRKAAAD